ncbi:formyltransferase family protein [Pararoseomonas sp. SCSIO 73927]|uniref:formyltransferase family protein n=1 Tax=Pararoseomonas sp. SCSIO 73927 TaxID=3114537 RepID=UPI0030D2158E
MVLLGLSNPYRRAVGGVLGQGWRHLRRSGPRLLAYLVVNMALPRFATALARGAGSLAARARARGIPVAAVEDVNGPAFHAALRAARPDLILTFHFDGILSADTIALAPGGGINVHPSLLPRHRGPIPTFWAEMEAEPAHGVTIHRLVPRIDAGAVLAQREVALPAGITASEAARRLHRAAVPLAGEVLAALAAGTAAETPAGAPLPYRPFPDRAALRTARQRGVRLLDLSDIRAALRIRA